MIDIFDIYFHRWKLIWWDLQVSSNQHVLICWRICHRTLYFKGMPLERMRESLFWRKLVSYEDKKFNPQIYPINALFWYRTSKENMHCNIFKWIWKNLWKTHFLAYVWHMLRKILIWCIVFSLNRCVILWIFHVFLRSLSKK